MSGETLMPLETATVRGLSELHAQDEYLAAQTHRNREKRIALIQASIGRVLQLKGNFLDMTFEDSPTQFRPDDSAVGVLQPDNYMVCGVIGEDTEEPLVLLRPVINATHVTYSALARTLRGALESEIEGLFPPIHPAHPVDSYPGAAEE